MSVFQILAVLFALFMMYTIRIHSRKKTLSVSESSMWYSIWTLFIIVALFPELVTGIATSLRFYRVFDFLVVAAFMILSVVTFNNYFSTKKIESRIEELVRLQSIKSLKKRTSHAKTT